MSEIRVQAEGSLRWAKASGSGTTWATASGAATALMAYCRGFTYDSARTTVQVMDRGVPTHHKQVSKQPITVTFDLAFGITANYPNITALQSGASLPGMVHLEHKATAPEDGLAIYHQFHGVAINSMSFQEGDQEDTIRFQGVALAMTGPTASGYIA